MNRTDPDRVDVAAATAAAGAAIVGGVFAAFSGIVMPAVVKLPPQQAISTMQAINKAAVRAPFMIPFLGTTALSVGLALRHLARPRGRRSALVLAGSTLYLAGFALTAVYHVPRNDRLAALPPDSTEALAYWTDNIDGWRRMNDVRATATLAAALAFAAAALPRRAG